MDSSILLEISQWFQTLNIHILVKTEKLVWIIVLNSQVLDVEMLHDHSEEFTVDFWSVMSQIDDDIFNIFIYT